MVVVSDTETASPVVVTAWTEVADREVAAAAERWTDDDVATIELRAALSDAPTEPVGDAVRPIAVELAFELGGHRIRTDAGDGWVRCVDCGGRFCSKRSLQDRRCRG